MVALGNPEYDPLIVSRQRRQVRPIDEIRDVLVVDQGAYPLGSTGKRQLAQALISIAQGNPEMTFTVKPRYLPDDLGDHLHSMSDHLYEHLREAPGNLVLLREPRDLGELIASSDAMVTTWSTAYSAAIAAGLPMMLIEGLHSDDVYDVRSARVAAAYRRLRETGCVVDWRELLDGTCRFSYADTSYVREEFHDLAEPCSPRVVDLLEAVKHTVIDSDRAFRTTLQLPYAEFMQKLDTIDTWPAGSPEAAVSKRFLIGANTAIQQLGLENRWIASVLDMRPLLTEWTREIDAESGGGAVDTAIEECRERCLGIKAAYFADHPDAVSDDRFVQDAYFDWLVQSKRFGDLWAYSGPVIVPESLEFNRGLAKLKRWRPLGATSHFLTSFALSLAKPGRELKKDRNIKVLLSKSDTSLAAVGVLVLLGLRREYRALSVLEVPPRPGFEVALSHKVRSLAALGRPVEAQKVYAQYANGVRAVPAHRRSGVQARLARAVAGVYGALLRRFVERLGDATADDAGAES
jgi:hypothetical protein